MKKLTMLLLTAFSLSVAAQHKTSTSSSNTKQSIKDDGNTMHISINSTKAGKDISYDRTFQVQGLNKQQKEVMVKNIMDSLGISQPPAPPAPPVFASAETRGKTVRSDIKQSIKDDGKTMHITINSNKAGKESHYDRTFSVRGMDKQQKDLMIKRVLDSLQVSK